MNLALIKVCSSVAGARLGWNQRYCRPADQVAATPARRDRRSVARVGAASDLVHDGGLVVAIRGSSPEVAASPGRGAEDSEVGGLACVMGRLRTRGRWRRWAGQRLVWCCGGRGGRWRDCAGVLKRESCGLLVRASGGPADERSVPHPDDQKP